MALAARTETSPKGMKCDEHHDITCGPNKKAVLILQLMLLRVTTILLWVAIKEMRVGKKQQHLKTLNIFVFVTYKPLGILKGHS